MSTENKSSGGPTWGSVCPVWRLGHEAFDLAVFNGLKEAHVMLFTFAHDGRPQISFQLCKHCGSVFAAGTAP